MKFPWANTLLLIFIIAELISGYFGLLSGSSDRAIFIQAHRVSGYGIIAIFLWKSRNIRHSLRFPRRAPPRTASIVLLATLVMTLALGFTWSFIGPFNYWLFSGVSWHIYVGAALVPILIWHSIYHTRGFPISFWADRRAFLKLSGLAALGIFLWQFSELASRLGGLNGANRRFTGSYEAASFSGNDFPRTSWLNDSPDRVDLDSWRLTIRGAVNREVSLTYQDLRSNSELVATIDCTGGWHSTQKWRGVTVADLLAPARPHESARSVTFTSVTGYYRRFSMGEVEHYILATHVGDEVLSHGHGFPMRLVAQGKRGFDWVKWIDTIEVNQSPKWLQPPLPLQ